MEGASASLNQIRIASGLSLLVGLWLAAVNFVIWAPVEVIGPWNHAILGLAVVLMAGYRLARPLHSAGMSWVIAALGVWLMASPFVFGYSLLTRLVRTDVIAGLLLVISGGWAGAAGGLAREVREVRRGDRREAHRSAEFPPPTSMQPCGFHER
jgi:hypothetical protein